MAESPQSLDHFFGIARRRWVLIGLIGGLVFSIAAMLALLLPPVYRSMATILIIEQEIPTDLIRSTVTIYADQQIERIKAKVLTRSQLLPIIKEHNLYPDLLTRKNSTAVLEEFLQNIAIEMVSADVVDKQTGRPTQATIAFTLSFEGPTPESTQRIANELTSLFLSENLKNREQQVHETTAFLKQESGKLSNSLGQLEEKIAIFKKKANGALPELFQMNMQLLSQVEREIVNVNQQAQVQEERIVYLEGEIVRNKNSLATGLENGSLGKQLQLLRRQYSSMASYLSTEHPDIIKIQGEIQALEQQGVSPVTAGELSTNLREERLRLASLRESYGEDHPDIIRSQATIGLLKQEMIATKSSSSRPAEGIWDDPIYVSLQTQLATAKSTLEHLRKSKEGLGEQARKYAMRVERTPELDPEYQTLLRDRDNAAQKFQEYRSRLLEAQVAEGLELERKGERFSLVEPPHIPDSPVRPNRKAILFLGLVLAFAGGIGSAALAEALDGSIHTVERLREVANVPFLSVIPYLPTPEQKRAKVRMRGMIGAGAIVATLVSLGMVHLFLLPLDVLWYVALRKMRLD